MQQTIEVSIYMEKGMRDRLVDRARELGLPLSAVVRDAVVKYFEDIPEVPDRDLFVPQPDDTIWQLPNVSRSFGALRVPHLGSEEEER